MCTVTRESSAGCGGIWRNTRGPGPPVDIFSPHLGESRGDGFHRSSWALRRKVNRKKKKKEASESAPSQYCPRSEPRQMAARPEARPPGSQGGAAASPAACETPEGPRPASKAILSLGYPNAPVGHVKLLTPRPRPRPAGSTTLSHAPPPPLQGHPSFQSSPWSSRWKMPASTSRGSTPCADECGVTQRKGVVADACSWLPARLCHPA